MSFFKKSILTLLVATITCGNLFSIGDGIDTFVLHQMHNDLNHCTTDCSLVTTAAAAQDQAELAELIKWEASNPADFTFCIPGVLTYAKHYASVAAQEIKAQATSLWSQLPSFNTIAQSVKNVGAFAKTHAVEKPYIAAGIAAGTLAFIGASVFAWKKFSHKKSNVIAKQEQNPRFYITNLD